MWSSASPASVLALQYMIGSRLGPWILDQELGRGAHASVYRAHAPDEPTPRQAAVKVLAADLAGDPGFLERFQREIETLRQLDHPNIVRLLESGVEDGRPWFAMELIEGPSLQAVLQERGKLPWSEVLELALQIAPALKHAHDRGVVHRDLKPSNLLVVGLAGDGSQVKLGDFGIASLFARPHLTAPGGVIGTAEYLSPEQAAGKPVTRRSDLYSLGVVLYTLITGRTPFTGEIVDLLHKHCYSQPERPGRLTPEIPHDLDALICDLLEKDPNRRPADGGVLFRRLDNLRRKLRRQAASSTVDHLYPIAITPRPGTQHVSDMGPATLMSKLMRAELEQQNQGGPLKRLLNRPSVLITLFGLCVGVLLWTFWPLSAETLYQRGAALMASTNPDDWEQAWDSYLKPLQDRFPNHGHQTEMAEFSRRIQTRQAEKAASLATRRAGPMTEAQCFYQEGLRLRQQGREDDACKRWRALIQGFAGQPAEAPWVRLAQARLDEEPGPVERKLEPVRTAWERVLDLRAQGKAEEADRIEKALRELYQNDPEALAIMK
jgi:serine/threonine protein kinase